jgi:hypothetical protein
MKFSKLFILLVLPLGMFSCVPLSKLNSLFTLPTLKLESDGIYTLSGALSLASADLFIKTIPRAATVALSTGGGSVSEALRIADFVSEQKVNLVVRGICGSSCANYLVGATPKLTLEPGGFIGFHGGVVNKYTTQLSACGGVKVCSSAQIQHIDGELWREMEFMKRHNLNLELLSLSDELTRGRSGLWTPDLEELACYGIKVESAPPNYPPRVENMVRTTDLSLELQAKIFQLCSSHQADSN